MYRQKSRDHDECLYWTRPCSGLWEGKATAHLPHTHAVPQGGLLDAPMAACGVSAWCSELGVSGIMLWCVCFSSCFSPMSCVGVPHVTACGRSPFMTLGAKGSARTQPLKGAFFLSL